MVGCLMTNELESAWEKAVMAYEKLFRHFSGMTEKTTKTSAGRHLNPGPPEYEVPLNSSIRSFTELIYSYLTTVFQIT